MPAPVVIDVGDAQPPRDLVVALVEACSQAAAPAATECRLVRDAPNEPYSAIAIVTWEEGGKARVEVGIRRDPVSEWRTRELTFQAEDAEVERYRSVGFVIGSLATASRDETAPEKATAEEPPAEPPPPPLVTPVPVRAPPHEPKPEPAPSTPAGPSHFWIGLSGTIGGGLDRGAARYGGRLGAGFRVLPVLAAVVSAGASLRARDETGLRAQWLDAGGGLAFSVWPPAGSHLELRAEVLAERFAADASNDVEQADMSRTTAAFRPGVDAVLVVARPLAIVVGGDATFRPATTVQVEGEKAGSTRNFELGAAAGLRLDL